MHSVVYYPLTHAQQRIWYTEKFYPGTSIANLGGFAKLRAEGGFNSVLLIQAIRRLVSLNDSLRLRLVSAQDGGEVKQYVSDDQDFDIAWLDYGDTGGDAGSILEWGEAELRKPMVLYDSHLFQFTLFKINGDECWLFVKVHHIIADGISMVMLVNQIIDLYLELTKGAEASQINPPSYLEHIQSEVNYEQSERYRKDKQYWHNKFAALPEFAWLKRSDSYGIRTEAGRLSKVIPDTLQTGVELFCKAYNVSPLSLFLSILDIYMWRATGQADVVVGTFMANRTNAKEKQMLGMFVSTVPVHTHVDANEHVAAFVNQKMKDQITIIRHQKYPYDVLVNELREKHGSVERLFGVSLEYQVMQWREKEDISYLTEPFFSGHEINDISIHVKERWDTGRLAMDIDYRTDLFTKDEIEDLFQRMMNLLSDALAHPHKKLHELEMCTPEEQQQLLQMSGDTVMSYRKDMTVHGVFEERAAAIASQTAIEQGPEMQLSYQELNEQSNRLARVLRSKGVGPDTPVAILMARSGRVPMVMLAIMKAGGAYVPIDPEAPRERVRFIIEDAGAKLVVADEELLQRGEVPLVETVLLEEKLLLEGDGSNLTEVAGPGNLAYIIYTSGTTGKPKGVMIEHRQVLHLVAALERQVYRAYDTAMRVGLIASFHFDASVQQIFAALLLGHTLCVSPKLALADGGSLADFYRANCIDVTDGTPAHVQMLLTAGDLRGVSLRHLLIGGEALPREAVRQLQQLFKQSGRVPVITNVYGPTECCVDASAFDILPEQDDADHGAAYLPIGKPLGGNRLYILDPYGRMQPVGLTGELCIAGEGVGRGYLNLPALTAEKFVADPFVPGHTMYRTGDLACWRPDGTVQFLGRMDDQVKIRGYRIELGEIEAVLGKHPDVEKAVVIARPDGRDGRTGADLCAFLVFRNTDHMFSITELRNHLGRELPPYMIPSYFVSVEQIPLTSSGKVDRRALLSQDIVISGGREYAAPTNEVEARIAGIWQDVLGVERVGLHDHFFELGGHSLKAMAVLSRVHKECGVEVPLQVIFQFPTVRTLAEYVAGAERKAFVAIEPAQISEKYPLSFAQKRVYVVSQLEEAGIGYNMPAAVRLDGPVDTVRLEQAFYQLIQRHESLRTSFISVDGTPAQRVHDHVPFRITTADQSDWGQLEATMTSFVRPFDLSQAPLLRVALVRLADEHHIMLVDMHHLVSDGVSIGIILSDLARAYSGEQLPELRLQYKDYAVWQARRQEAENDRDEPYWLTAFSGELPVLQLLTDSPRPAVQSFHGDRVSMSVSAGLKDKLHILADANGATLFMVLLATYYALLARYTGQDDIVVGTPAAGRNHGDLGGIVGMFVNTLPLRMRINRQHSFVDLLDDLRRTALEAFEHQSYPLEQLVEKLALPRDLSRNPLFDAVFSLQNAMDGMPDIGEIQLSVYETNFHVAKFDLTLQAKEEPDGITLEMDYSTALFTRGTVQRMLGHYVNLLEAVAQDSTAPLGQHRMLTPEEERPLLQDFNPPATQYPKHRTIVELLEEQAQTAPDAEALSFEGHKLSYKQLNERANRLARSLCAASIRPGDVVAMLMNRSVEMIVGVLAILKAGAAYVPVDPEHPVQRMEYFLSDSGAAVLLTQRAHESKASELAFSGMCLYADDAEHYTSSGANLGVAIQPGDLANFTYTSGTSGNPKGNMVTHANIIRTMKNTNYLEVSNQDVFISLSNYVFDAFMFDVFGSLLNGAKLVLAAKDTVLDIALLPKVIEREGITIMMITTALFNLLVDVSPGCLTGIRKVLFGGERASVEHVRKALQAAGPGTLLHMYGPSESTVFATYHAVDEIPDDATAIPIGKPVSNTTVLILDAFRQPQPIGVPGELCVGGDGLVLGYANRPELTAEKFVTHPFDGTSRLYRTGDLARWLPDGSIEFIGRIDHQVKIRGQRIELGEIEHQLLRHTSIREAVVLAVDAPSGAAGDKMLCAYVVADAPLSHSELREHAAKELPVYMIPTTFVQMEELPLTGNGKVDRRALPQPVMSDHAGADYTAPRSPAETQLTAIWAEVLGIKRIGVHDNFFELGGHSLKAMSMLARIRQTMQAEVPLRTLFEAPTVAALAEVIASAETNAYAAIPLAAPQETYPLSSAQKRLYILHQLQGAQQSYNMPSVLRIEGPLDRERFEAVMTQLIERHEALRTSFDEVVGEPVQRIHQQVDFTVAYREAGEDQAERLIKQFIRPFDLKQAPLLRVEVVGTAEQQHLLLFDMHHIISDGMSVSVLIKEITQLYAGETLQPLRIQYKDYAAWQQSWADTDSYREQEDYWLAQFADEPPVLSLPTDHARPAVQQFAGGRVDFELDSELSQGLYKLARDTDTTLYMVLLAAYSTLLAKLSGQEDIVVGSPVAGRPHTSLDGIVGMFVNTLAMRTRPRLDQPFTEYLREVKQLALGAYEHQNYPFEELVGKIQTERDMSRNPVFDALLALQNMDMATLQMSDARLEPYNFDFDIAKFDLSLSVVEQDERLACSMEYSTALFKRETIERWIGHLVELLRNVTAQPDVTLAHVNMMTEADIVQVVAGFNDTKRAYPRDQTIHALFEEQAERVPDKVAVVLGADELTYRELNERANRLAGLLRAKGVQPESIIGMMLEPSVDVVVAIIAILKAGCAYMPIDPDYPDERLRYLIADSRAALVLTTGRMAGRLQGIDVLCIDDDNLAEALNKRGAAEQSMTTPHVGLARNLAYVIYTSGSTGQPKGVMVEHRNVVRLVKNAGYIPLDDDCRMAQTGSISFDASTFEMFGALLNGGTLYPVPKSTLLDAHGFAQFLAQHQITTMWLTSPLFNQLAQENAAMFAYMRDLIIGGDALTPRYVNQVRHACPGLTLWNGYGPTENTTFSTCFRIDEDYAEHIPIGRPIGNSTAYIVNAYNQPQPIGVPGELCVGGDGVARGYSNRPDLTLEKFVADPFAPGKTMYRTGDLARWLPNGSIEFMGRIDQQVKVRGFRIELGEIEAQLMLIDDVEDAVVVVRQDAAGANYLCAYVAAERELSAQELRTALSQTLPAYMLPSYFVQVDRMPLTANGKVDRKALPEQGADTSGEEYAAPRNEGERILCEVWQDVLGVQRVGITDNFFSLGGDSIKAIQMAARLNKQGWKLDMKDLFQNPTIGQVSVYLQSTKGAQAAQTPVIGEVALTPIQKWFFERRFTDIHHWNQAVMLFAPKGLQPDLAERALNKIIEHHDALRMSFEWTADGHVSQFNHAPADMLAPVEVIRLDEPEEQLEQAVLLEAERIQSGIDLVCGPLVKTAIFHTQRGDHLLIAIHHLVVDGVSWRILMEDLVTGYVQAEQGQAIVLPAKTHSYMEWATRLQQYANSYSLLQEVSYWSRLEQLGGRSLPKDAVVDERRMRHARTVGFTLTPGETELLTTRAHAAYRTEMNDILLTALGLAVHEWTGFEQLLVNLEGHGREEIMEDINVSRTVGWFTTQYPVVLDMRYADDASYQIKRVKEDLRHIPNKGIGFGILRYLTAEANRAGLSFQVVPEISFNYLGEYDNGAGMDLFKRSHLPIGNSLSPSTEKMHALDVVGVIEAGALSMSISYDEHEYAEHTMRQLSENFKMQLQRLIEHCLSQDGAELTPSDLGDDDLTLEELDKLLEII
ncbi:non-ribosomal peptide synthetase [Paenibacillus xerothermodurans]|uniref:Non-ribosomal peptide synthetase n=1 Tax=Paenibacillus xerothermodurans TaxID=1977292 RepID=A0A2W1N839_PAEXE|nr:non-ribosomal peptide synthetase [Paenibacillus xerothermodurans]PZE20567.1 non-ribosomal peptide synthetase [Paenibacillus xerothermodurans]